MEFETRILTEAEYEKLWPELMDIKPVFANEQITVHKARHDGAELLGDVYVISPAFITRKCERVIMFDRVGFIEAA